MAQLSDGLAIFGTTQPVGQVRVLTLGGMSVDLAGGAVQAVHCNGVEVMRGLAYPIRNPDWGTWAEQTVAEDWGSGQGGAHYQRDFTTAEGAITGRFRLDLTDAGLTANVAFRALRALSVNRAGFVLLHPVTAEAGLPLTVTHPDGRTTATAFPRQIAPAQPAIDIAGLAFDLPSLALRLTFGGEVFEMEDQRNWSDASFKTYCRPLSQPYPFAIAAGQEWSQTVTLTCTPRGPAGAAGRATDMVTLGPVLPQPFPVIALAADDGWPVADRGLSGMPVLLRLDLRGADWRRADGGRADGSRADGSGADGSRADGSRADWRGAVAAVSPGAQVEVEAVVSDDPGLIAQELAALRHALGASFAGAVTGLLVLPAAYLASYQPDADWPQGPTPQDAARLARDAFPGIAIGGGVLSNFTELNRLPGPRTGGDFVSYGTTAIVHAADDRAVMQTLQALPQIHASAAALYPGLPLRLGLQSIGMRTNPYGRACAPNPAGARVAMAERDPRHGALFGAAFMVGVLAATEGHPVARLALGAVAGPFDLADAPAWRVVHAAAAMAGAMRLSLTTPDGVAGVAVRNDDGVALILANLGATPRDVAAPLSGDIRVLDANILANAQDWRGDAPTLRAGRLHLPPYAVAFITLPDGAVP